MPWPLSIAAPEAALAQYQMVFRHIFELKWVERELNRVCALYQRTTGLASRRSRMRRASLGGGGPGTPGDALAASLAASYSTCQLMTHFFRQYLMYVTFEVMEPLWGAFEAKVQTASSLDEVRYPPAVPRPLRMVVLVGQHVGWWRGQHAAVGALLFSARTQLPGVLRPPFLLPCPCGSPT